MVSPDILLVLAVLWFWGSLGALWLLANTPDDGSVRIGIDRFVLGGPFAWLILSAAALWWTSHFARTALTRFRQAIDAWSLRPVERAIQDYEIWGLR